MTNKDYNALIDVLAEYRVFSSVPEHEFQTLVHSIASAFQRDSQHFENRLHFFEAIEKEVKALRQDIEENTSDRKYRE